MTAIGKYMRVHSPKLYFFVTDLHGRWKDAMQSDFPYITDSLGGSFKEYLSTRDENGVVGKLTRGLDQDSIHTVKVILERIHTYPDEKNKSRGKDFKGMIGGRLPVEQKDQQDRMEKYLKEVRKKYQITPLQFDESVFYFHHGLRFLPPSVSAYVQDEDFLDCGAYIGDSAIALSGYGYKKIYSIEISNKSIARYKQNLKQNGIAESKYEIIQLGIASRDDLESVALPDTGSAGFSLFRTNSQYDHIKVNRRSLDYITSKYNIRPKYIKADIEGAALDLVQGGVNTLRNNRPVVSIAIYHNPMEFFEVKPFLEHILEDYTFSITKMESKVHKNHCHSEIVLLGYPNEILYD